MRLTAKQIEEHAYRSLGRLFVVVADIELKLALGLGVSPPESRRYPGVKSERLSFQEKMEELVAILALELAASKHRQEELAAWRDAADVMRQNRNRFAHGRWAFLEREQRVAHVAGYPDGDQETRRYAVDDLDAIVQQAERVAVVLDKIIANRWR